MGKWDHTGLPRLPVEMTADFDPAKQQRIDARKAALKGKEPVDLAKEYRKARDEQDKAKEAKSKADLEVDALTQLINEQFEAKGIMSVKMEDGSSVGLQTTPYPAVGVPRDDCAECNAKKRCCPTHKQVDAAKVKQWAIENGYEAKLILPWGTLGEISKERIEAAEDPIPGVRLYLKPTLYLRGR